MASTTDALGKVTTYSYDGYGNIIGAAPPSPLGGVSATYDSLSRIVGLTDGKGQRTGYSYDALDRITQVAYADGSTITYVYDADGNNTSLVDSTGTTTFSYDLLNRLTEKTLPNGTSSSYGYDAVGNLVDSYSYDPYGAIVSSAESVPNPWRIAGAYLDAATGLYKIGARYYDSSVGRWTQWDPVLHPFDPRGWNPYAFVGDDPVNFSDPTGTDPAYEGGDGLDLNGLWYLAGEPDTGGDWAGVYWTGGGDGEGATDTASAAPSSAGPDAASGLGQAAAVEGSGGLIAGGGEVIQAAMEGFSAGEIGVGGYVVIAGVGLFNVGLGIAVLLFVATAQPAYSM